MPQSEPPRQAPLLGAHLSVAGGLYRALESAEKLGFRALQIFSKNQQQWRCKPLEPGALEAWHQRRVQSKVTKLTVHASYLINLGSGAEELWEKSLAAVIEELTRCEQLGIPWLVLHPGAHGGAGVPSGLKRVCEALGRIMQETATLQAGVLLETTAGQGSCLGSRFDEMGEILSQLKEPARVGICLDTAHLFAAGYDLVSSYEPVMQELGQKIGFEKVHCIHVNDSAKALGSRVDRHAHIGQGTLGIEPFRRIMNDPRLDGVPKILETPKGINGQGVDWDKANSEKLLSLLGG